VERDIGLPYILAFDDIVLVWFTSLVQKVVLLLVVSSNVPRLHNGSGFPRPLPMVSIMD
jgi:hypothetical protein